MNKDMKFNLNIPHESDSSANKTSIIFLDIDGVLRPDISLSHATFERAYQSFSPIAVGLLNRLCYETNAELVISSNWRVDNDPEYILKYIHQALAALNTLIPNEKPLIPCYMRIFYRTPNIKESWRTPVSQDLLDRSWEIDEWLKIWGHWVKNYCILDDGKSLFSPRHYPNLVLIERGDSGFDIDYYVQAIEMLEDTPNTIE